MEQSDSVHLQEGGPGSEDPRFTLLNCTFLVDIQLFCRSGLLILYFEFINDLLDVRHLSRKFLD